MTVDEALAKVNLDKHKRAYCSHSGISPEYVNEILAEEIKRLRIILSALPYEISGYIEHLVAARLNPVELNL